MFPRLKEFIACTRGNIAFMTAGALVPMLPLVAGGLELAQYNKTQSSMQFAADSAVMAAITDPQLRWSKRIRRAHHFFDLNFQHRGLVNQVNKRLSGENRRGRVELTYRASTDVKTLFGELNPFTKSRITVKATAEHYWRSKRPPRLISSKGSSGFTQ